MLTSMASIRRITLMVVARLRHGDIWRAALHLHPMEADGFVYNGQGSLPRPTLRIGNLFSTITALIATLPNGLEGAKVTRIRTLARYIDDGELYW